MRSIFLCVAALAAVASAARADPSLSESVSGNVFTLGQIGGISANWSGFAAGETLNSAAYTFALVPLKPVYTPEAVQTGSTPVYGYVYPPAGTAEPGGQVANGSDFPQQVVVGSRPIYTQENVLTGFNYAPNAIVQTPIYTQENVQTGSTPIYGYAYPPAGTPEPGGQIANGSDFPVQVVVGSTPVYTLEDVFTGYQPVSADFTLNTPGFYLASVMSTVTVGDPYTVSSTILSLDQSDEIIHVLGVPEPASWALLITGFGLAGSMLRRKRAVATTA